MPEKLKRHHRDVVHGSCSYANVVTGVEDNKLYHLVNKTLGGHQTDVYSSQVESSDNTSALAGN
jgi:hypothetical protein